MRIAVVHSFYRSDSPSGENQVVAQQVELLREAGHDVLLVARSSDELGTGLVDRVRLAPSAVVSVTSQNPASRWGSATATRSAQPVAGRSKSNGNPYAATCISISLTKRPAQVRASDIDGACRTIPHPACPACFNPNGDGAMRSCPCPPSPSRARAGPTTGAAHAGAACHLHLKAAQLFAGAGAVECVRGDGRLIA